MAIGCFGRDPRRLQLLFLNDADKSSLVKWSLYLWLR